MPKTHETKTEQLGVLAYKVDGVITHIVVVDEKTHHKIFYTVEETDFEGIKRLLNGETI